MSLKTTSHTFQTRLGLVESVYQDAKLTKLQFIEEHNSESELESEVLPYHTELEQQLLAFLDSKLERFDISMEQAGTDFQKEIWKLLLDIDYGKTCSYLDLAKQYGDEKALRAIASANGANPIMIIIPCHRVIGSDGSLTGYAGGLWRKEALLDMEHGVQRLF